MNHDDQDFEHLVVTFVDDLIKSGKLPPPENNEIKNKLVAALSYVLGAYSDSDRGRVILQITDGQLTYEP